MYLILGNCIKSKNKYILKGANMNTEINEIMAEYNGDWCVSTMREVCRGEYAAVDPVLVYNARTGYLDIESALFEYDIDDGEYRLCDISGACAWLGDTRAEDIDSDVVCDFIATHLMDLL